MAKRITPTSKQIEFVRLFTDSGSDCKGDPVKSMLKAGYASAKRRSDNLNRAARLLRSPTVQALLADSTGGYADSKSLVSAELTRDYAITELMQLLQAAKSKQDLSVWSNCVRLLMQSTGLLDSNINISSEYKIRLDGTVRAELAALASVRVYGLLSDTACDAAMTSDSPVLSGDGSVSDPNPAGIIDAAISPNSCDTGDTVQAGLSVDDLLD